MPIPPSVEKSVNLLHGFKQVYKPRNTSQLLWIIMARQHISPEVTVTGCRHWMVHMRYVVECQWRIWEWLWGR